MPVEQHAFSIDVEDWFHPELVRRHVSEADRVPRLEHAVAPLLELLRQRGITATFFMLAPIVDAHRELVAQLHREGHEIACHGVSHRPLWELTREEFRAELQEWKAVVQSIDSAIPMRGYRAPTFSIDERTAWALEVLAEEGFIYDSSIFPFKNHVYGIAGAPVAPYTPDPTNLLRHSTDGPIREFPLTVLPLGQFRLPVSGGFYLRALPYSVIKGALRRVARERPFVLYCHPWEFDVETPRRNLGLVTYTGMRTALHKLERLLDEFPCTRMDKVLAAYG